jgi:hypothetical protein
MSLTLDQIFTLNPITSNAPTDLMYFVQSPYTPGTDAGMTFANFAAQFTSSTAIINPAHGGTGINNGTSTITIGGNVSFVGAFTFSGNLTGNTSVIFPVSGTLATTSQLPTLPLSLAQGGTSASLVASNGGVFYSTASAGAILSGTATANQVLLSGASSAPSWSSAVYPASTTINQILYSSSNNVISGLVTANNGVMITSALGVPSISSTLPLAVQTNITELGTITVGIWNGSVITGTFGGTGVNNGANTITLGGNILTANSFTTVGNFAVTQTYTGITNVTFPTSGTLATTAAIPSFPLSLANGGTNANLTASNGGIFYSTATAGAILSGTATARQMLQSGLSTTPTWSTTTWPATTTINQILYSSAASVISGLATANSGVLVTSSLGVPSVIAAGTTAQVLQASSAGTPAWSTATYPATTTINQILFSSAANTVTGLATANSGTLVTSSTGVPSILAAGTTGQVLQASSAGTPAWSTTTYPATNAINTLLYASAANVMSVIAAVNNGVLITSATGVPSLLADGTTGQVLTATTGSPPAWANATGTGTVSSGLINQLAWYAAAGTTVSGLTIVNSAILTTTSGGVPTWVASTGSGAPVRGTSPTLITPVLGAATATSLAFSPTTGGIIGTTAADNATAGDVGEMITSNILFASAVSLTTTVAANITSISLSAGDWNIEGNVLFNPSGTTVAYYCWISTTSATLPDASLRNQINIGAGAAIGATGFSTPFLRVNVNALTTVYLSARADFSTGAVTGCGSIFARRVR